MRKTFYGVLLLGLLFLSRQQGKAQASPARSQREIDVGLVYNSLYRNTTDSAQFWQEGGSIELSTDITHHWGAAGSVTGEHASSVANAGYDLSTVTTILGPRYTVVRGKKAIYAESLLGESFGFDSYFPHIGGPLHSSNTFAFQIGGGIDLRLTPHIAVRALQASWLRTGFPNATTNVQNSLQIGAGIVFRLSH